MAGTKWGDALGFVGLGFVGDAIDNVNEQSGGLDIGNLLGFGNSGHSDIPVVSPPIYTFTEAQDIVRNLVRTYLGREPEQSDVLNMAQKIVAGVITPEALKNQYMASDEYKSKHPTGISNTVIYVAIGIAVIIAVVIFMKKRG